MSVERSVCMEAAAGYIKKSSAPTEVERRQIPPWSFHGWLWPVCCNRQGLCFIRVDKLFPGFACF